MTPEELKKLIREEVMEAVTLQESGYDLADAADDLPLSEIQDYYSKTLWNLGNLLEEVNGFNERFTYTMRNMGMQEKLAIQTYVAQLKQAADILVSLKEPLKVLAEIQNKDNSGL